MNTQVKRESLFLTRDDLIEHIREVGKAIINDAEHIAPTPLMCSGIEITAHICPSTEATEVEYHITRYADPRLTGAEKETEK